MSKDTRLSDLMLQELPSISYQKRLSYRTTKREVQHLYNLLNESIFNNKLPPCHIEVVARCRKYWGLCTADDWNPDLNSKKSNCTIRVSDKWFCKQWLITILAHEMCHQYQYDVESYKRHKLGLRPIMSHGPTFFIFKEKLAKQGISLKKAHGSKKWFRHQNLWKC